MRVGPARLQGHDVRADPDRGATEIPLDDYREYGVPILDQGMEGACTGFGLATVRITSSNAARHIPTPRR